MARAARHPLLLVFLLAFGLRAALVIVWDPPLLFAHPYNYYRNALGIAEHANPLGYVLSSDRWREWVAGTTIAPLYYLLLGAFFDLFGPGLLPLRLFQSVLDAIVASAVGALGLRLAGPAGILAGVIYAFHWSAAELVCWTLTENLHTVLLVGAFALLAREASSPSRSRAGAFVGGLLLGLSGLTRSVSSAFVPFAAGWRLSIGGLALPRPLRLGLPRRLLPAILLLAGSMAAISPWSLRNWTQGDQVPIETVGFFNLWDDNSRFLVSPERYERQLRTLEKQPSPDDYARTAIHFTVRNVVRNPVGFLRKISTNFWHLVRPDGLHNLLVIEYPDPVWRQVGIIVFDDLVLLVVVPLFAGWLLGGPPSPTRRLLSTWTLYYLSMLLVVFHSEVRYRSALVPMAMAGAVAGAFAMRDKPRRLFVGTAAGALISAAVLFPYLPRAVHAMESTLALRPVRAALDRGDLVTAERLAEAAAGLDPQAARPWRTYGRWLTARDLPERALAAYERASQSRAALPWASVVVRPRLLLEAGRPEDVEAALREAHLLSWNTDPWVLLEVAWAELPPPRTDEIVVGGSDYGAVRGFHHPRGLDARLIGSRRPVRNTYDTGRGPVFPPGLHRWTRGTAHLRLRPRNPAARYDVTLRMGSPFPSPLKNPVVRVQVGDGLSERVTLDPQVREWRFSTPAPPDGVIAVRLDAPTWGRAGEAAEQGVRVDLLRLEPSGSLGR